MLFGKNKRNMSVHYVIDRAGDESWKNTEFLQILIYAQNSEKVMLRRPIQGISSTCSTESTISLTSSRVTPGMMRSASVNARCKALRAILASWEETRGNSYHCVRDARGRMTSAH